MFTFSDYVNLRSKIKEEKKPLLIRSKFGRVAIVLNKEATVFFQKRGYVSITVDDLGNLLLDAEGSPRDNQKEIIESIFSVSSLFTGRVKVFTGGKNDKQMG